MYNLLFVLPSTSLSLSLLFVSLSGSLFRLGGIPFSTTMSSAAVEVHPPPQTAYPPPGAGAKYAAAPPPGYPVNGATPTTQQVPLKTKQRGDGFWKGCAAALCCCCVFEACCD